jgi:parallel beta-helix repeat protein
MHPARIAALVLASLAGPLSAITIEVSAPASVQDGSRWVVATAPVSVRGVAASGSAASVRVNGAPVAYEPSTRAWQAELSPLPGANAVLVEALSSGGAVLESAEAELVLVPAANRVTGPLAADAVWSGAYVVEGTLTVPTGFGLTISAGTLVLLGSAAAIRVEGRLVAEGSDDEPVRFARHGAGRRWKQIIFLGAEDSRLEGCIIEHADSEGEHQDYYEPGTRSYHEAIVAVASSITVDGCTFRNLPDAGSGMEGDAIAVISDDPDLPGEASAFVRRSRFLSIGQGVHARFSHVLVEECRFAGKRGDNDDVDLWGESDPPPLIQNNIFDPVEAEDRINPTRCSAIIVGNILRGSTDHGIVLRDAGSPIVMNNIIEDCPNGGIAIENSNTALLVNNTIVNCGRGLRLFDLGRWGPPYRLNPGGGTATAINCIIWDCPQAATLEDSSNTTIADRGSHLTVISSIVEGGQAAISVGGSQSTLTWGSGNKTENPLFVDLAGSDYRLREGSPAIDAGTADGAPPRDLEGTARPCGAAVDIGAYEACAGGPVRFVRGDANTDGGTDISDAISGLLYLFGGDSEPSCLSALDINDDAALDISDPIVLLDHLFRGGPAPASPIGACGSDPTTDALGCVAFPPCG